jgi:high affinity Mn2+ porin
MRQRGFSRVHKELIGLLLLGRALIAQDDSGSWTDRLWLSGQANFITQGHSTFTSPYSGPNSLSASAQIVTSRVITLFSGVRINDTTDFLFDLEETGGNGIGQALGVAGFPNLDVVRNPTLSHNPYIARAMLHKMFPLSRETMESERGPFQLESMTPVRRIDIRAGKMSTVDWFDVNSIGSDSHYQFMNWSVDNNGAYDYAADTRGYTYGVEIEYNDRNWALRYGGMMMPKVANGLHLDADLARARGDNFEYEVRPRALSHRVTVLRGLAFVNHADMGSYAQAIHQYLAGQTTVPDITAVRQQGRVKYGFGFNGEQELTSTLRAFERFGWNDGHTESYAYTEIDQSFSGGADLRGEAWHRGDDKLGVAFVSNGISGDHREYLALGGSGFLLGDGKLNYGRESIIEAYYNSKLWHGVWASLDVQRIWNPGYNQDRGPVFVGAVRLHLEAALFRGAR